MKVGEVGVPTVAHGLRTQLVSMRTQVRWLTSLSGLRIRRCLKLWCRSQMQLRTSIAVAVVAGLQLQFCFDPSLGISIGHRRGPKKEKRKKERKKVDEV